MKFWFVRYRFVMCGGFDDSSMSHEFVVIKAVAPLLMRLQQELKIVEQSKQHMDIGDLMIDSLCEVPEATFDEFAREHKRISDYLTSVVSG